MPDTPPTDPAAPAAPSADAIAQVAPADASVPAAASDTAPALAELAPAECAARLAELFPALFAVAPNTPPRPLKLRIQADIQQRAPGLFTRRSLSPFLHRHTTSTAYLRALVASPHRFDLDGAPAGAVSDEHRQAAVDELERRRALNEARRAAQRQAQRGQAPTSDAPAAAAPDRAAVQRVAPGRPRRRDDASGHRRRDDPRGVRDRAARPPRPAHAPRDPHASQPVAPARAAPASADRDASAAAPLALPAADDSGRRERALLLRAFETSTLSRANFCALKRIDPATLDALLEQARSEAASPRPRAPLPRPR